MGDKLSFPPAIPEWMQAEVADYDLPLAQPPRTILDIGANIGAFSLLAAQRWPKAEIHAYEPVPDNFTQLFRLTHHASRITRHPAAVRSFPGTDEIFLGDRAVTCGFHQLGRQTANTARVRCVDAATLPPAEFIKIDTEGCEVEIVGRLDLSKTQVLAVEYHRTEDVAQLKQLAESHGLQLHQEKPTGPTWGVLVFARAGALSVQSPELRSPDSRLKTQDSRLFVALPVYGAMDVFFTQSLLKLIADPPCEMMVRMNPGDSLVSRARNTLTADFLESNATHLLFIDSDLIFSADHVARIFAHPEEIVGGFYPKKQEGEVAWVCNGCIEPTEPREDNGLQSVRYMGTGFLRIHRSVFERMIAVYGEQLRYKPDHRDRVEYDFWSVGTYQYPDGSRRFLSEDWFFCQRALDLGFQVWGDTRIVLKHVGQAIYPLQSQQAQIFSGAGVPPAKSLFGASLPTTTTDRAGHGVIAPTDLARNFQPSTLNPQPV